MPWPSSPLCTSPIIYYAGVSWCWSKTISWERQESFFKARLCIAEATSNFSHRPESSLVVSRCLIRLDLWLVNFPI
jgi:hypothetical protein